MDKRPIYDISIDPAYQEGENELGWDETAFTSDPAIMVKGMAYKSQAPKQLFADKKKYRVTAPAMIPMDIYRSDEDGDYERGINMPTTAMSKRPSMNQRNSKTL